MPDPPLVERGINSLRFLAADANETAAAWQFAPHDGPVGLVRTPQALPILDLGRAPDDAMERGAYVLKDPDRRANVTVVATGSEVHLVLGLLEPASESATTA